MSAEDTRTYVIANGVHRSLVAWHLGRRTIRAVDTPGEVMEVPIDKLLSPRDTVGKANLRALLPLGRRGVEFLPIEVYDSRYQNDPASLATYPSIPELYAVVKGLIDACDR